MQRGSACSSLQHLRRGSFVEEAKELTLVTVSDQRRNTPRAWLPGPTRENPIPLGRRSGKGKHTQRDTAGEHSGSETRKKAGLDRNLTISRGRFLGLALSLRHQLPLFFSPRTEQNGPRLRDRGRGKSSFRAKKQFWVDCAPGFVSAEVGTKVLGVTRSPPPKISLRRASRPLNKDPSNLPAFLLVGSHNRSQTQQKGGHR